MHGPWAVLGSKVPGHFASRRCSGSRGRSRKEAIPRASAGSGPGLGVWVVL